MSDAKMYRDSFEENLVEFCHILSSHFPDVEQFVIASTLIEPAFLTDPGILTRVMQKAFDVREMIFSRNEAFFTEDKSNLFDFDSNSEAGAHVNALQDLWHGDRMSDDMKGTVWDWLTVLAKYCQRYFEKIT
jgi:hypothetical protein